MARLSLALVVSLSFTVFGCDGAQETGTEEARQQTQAELTPAGECPPDWPGPWTACPEARWVEELAERAAYRITGETGSALIAVGNGRSFYIWATEAKPAETGTMAKREKWRRLGTVEGVEVYGDEGLWRWWPGEGFVVWLQAGPHSNSQIPSLDEMDSLVSASKTVPPPR
jgi:hypothetical protein